ncbi:uncharacterized protein MKZ38_008550 [Zalerion maritima]|uniref:DUF7932 domain-containing protein n=1 Tax=Zalerion maritima TaxID=339359 RepID=A0AAD5WTB2_9PEZI|nr:uncharacterized protein MKZ38_008550 [Zalerion maritima]
MNPVQLEKIGIFAAGQPGTSGIQTWDGSTNNEAPKGCPGRNGRDASWPGPGTDGHDVRVRLSYATDRPSVVQVFGEGPLTGTRWEVDRSQEVFIDCRGGNGGNGGWGELGQTGGQGYSGRDATKHSDATCGGPGHPGGNGGRGTSGADGGNAGGAFVTVSEDDLDTLVALTWSTRGGLGGASGVHGEAGSGGRGGLGGNGCSWTETHSHTISNSSGTDTEYYTTRHHRPGAPPGPQGPGGMRATEPLFAGRSGSNGIGQIKVLRNDLTEGTYTSRYQLHVVSFDVIDENEDGINEPGEFLHIKNVVVENRGAMPSPKGNILQMGVQPTQWLQPVTGEYLQLPREIAPGATVKIPGTLRAFIKNETLTRSPKTNLRATDTVRLVAFFERLQRPLPEFVGEAQVVYQYPLVMTEEPTYLDCVARGQLVRFSWKIRNISTKPYGTETLLRRVGGTRMADPGGVFDLTYAEESSPHEVTDFLEELGPGEEVPITQDFHVSHSISPFSSGELCVSLMLADPHSTGSNRMVQYFNLPIQISASYSYNPLSRFLLVMNAATPNQLILQTISFLENGLHACVDLFNLSLVGSFMIDAQSGEADEERHDVQCVIDKYVGKTVIIFGNSMQYFQNGTREPWDLLDPWETCDFANNGTNFLFLNTANTTGLRDWSYQIMNPAYDGLEPSAGETKEKVTAPKLIRSMTGDSMTDPRPLERVNTFPVKKPLFRNLDKVMQAKADKVQKTLDKKMPLRRFMVVPCDEHEEDPEPEVEPEEGKKKKKTKKSKRKLGNVAIVEGLPHNAKLVAGMERFKPERMNLSDYNIALITHSLPFEDQCHIFWNLLSASSMPGADGTTVSTGAPAAVRAEVAYAGEKLAHFLEAPKFKNGDINGGARVTTTTVIEASVESPSEENGVAAAAPEAGGQEGDAGKEHHLDNTAMTALSWSIATQLNTELSRFCLKAPWPDMSISTKTILPSLPLLHTFVSSFPKASAVQISSDSSAAITALARVLGPVVGSYDPISFPQWLGQNVVRVGNRRTKLRSVLTTQISAVISNISADQAAKKDILRLLKSQSRDTKKKLKALRRGSSGERPNRAERVHEMSCQLLGDITGSEGAKYLNLNDTGTLRSVAPGRGGLAEKRMTQLAVLGRILEDREWSTARLEEMVNPEDAMPE